MSSSLSSIELAPEDPLSDVVPFVFMLTEICEVSDDRRECPVEVRDESDFESFSNNLIERKQM